MMLRLMLVTLVPSLMVRGRPVPVAAGMTTGCPGPRAKSGMARTRAELGATVKVVAVKLVAGAFPLSSPSRRPPDVSWKPLLAERRVRV